MELKKKMQIKRLRIFFATLETAFYITEQLGNLNTPLSKIHESSKIAFEEINKENPDMEVIGDLFQQMVSDCNDWIENQKIEKGGTFVGSNNGEVIIGERWVSQGFIISKEDMNDLYSKK
jgi:hypothetical protein